jgi:peptide/nickel transport system permease protein
MTNYLIRRSFQMVIVVFLASIAIYLLLNAIPGGPLSGINLSADQRQRFTPEEIARMEAFLGLNKPIYLAYATWLAGEDWVDEVGNAIGNPDLNDRLLTTGTWADYQSPTCSAIGGSNDLANPNLELQPCKQGIIRGDFGTSWRLARGQTVTSIIGSRLQNTVILMTTVAVLSLLVGIPIGIFSAVRQYTLPDYLVTTFSFFGIAMPTFWFGLMLIIIFGLMFQRLGWPYFPSGNVVYLRVMPGSIQDALGITAGSFADRVVHLILPTLMLSLASLAGWSRFMRGQLLEVMRQDYVRTARAKGLVEKMVIGKHAVRNALIPIITIVVFEIPGIFGGAIVTETIFNYPGIGRLFITALGSSDWPIVMAILFISAILVVIATLVGDLLYTVVDPRIRFE